jgi:hypothetical protein
VIVSQIRGGAAVMDDVFGGQADEGDDDQGGNNEKLKTA